MDPVALSPADQTALDRLLRGLAEPSILTWARAYVDAGLSVVPIWPDRKYPPVSWKPYQERHATEAELQAWFVANSALRIGVVTGRISNLLVIDVDYRHGGQESVAEPVLASTAAGVVVTPGGRHYWYRYPVGREVRSRNAWRPGVDRKADRGITLAPPSPGYTWERLPDALR